MADINIDKRTVPAISRNGRIYNSEGVATTSTGNSGSSNQTEYSANNGITLTGTTFSLGGELLGNTDISLNDSTFRFHNDSGESDAFFQIDTDLWVNGYATFNGIIKYGTGLVTNFNADYLDGQHGSYYASAVSVAATFLPRSGGTITGSLTINGTTTLNGITKIGTTLVTNLNADLLDGKHALDFADVVHEHSYLDLQDLPMLVNVANAADNRVLTSGSNQYDINAESYLTFNGYLLSTIDLSVSGTATLSAITKIGTGLITNLNADMVDGKHAADFN